MNIRKLVIWFVVIALGWVLITVVVIVAMAPSEDVAIPLHQ